MKQKQKWYGVCTVTQMVTFLGEFDDPEEATGPGTGVAYEAPYTFGFTPMTEKDILELARNITKCVL